jgi:hypothetical protein
VILPRSGLIIAKVISVLVLELIQTVILVGVAAAFYDWRPAGGPLLALLLLHSPESLLHVDNSVRSIALPLFTRRGDRGKQRRKCAQRLGNMRGSDRSRRSRTLKQCEDVYVYDTVHPDETELYEGEERPTVPMRGIRSTVNAAFTVPQILWPQVKMATP